MIQKHLRGSTFDLDSSPSGEQTFSHLPRIPLIDYLDQHRLVSTARMLAVIPSVSWDREGESAYV